MIVVFHDRTKVTKIRDIESGNEHALLDISIQGTVLRLASDNPDHFIGWCHDLLEQRINKEQYQEIFHHDLIMASYAANGDIAVPAEIGYVEDDTPFLKVKHDVVYPTWLMSSDIGGLHAKVAMQCKPLSEIDMSFDGFLNHLSKFAMHKGLFCYSDPRLLMPSTSVKLPRQVPLDLFTFVKSHYRFRWLFLLFMNYWFYQKQIKIVQLLKGLIAKRVPNIVFDFSGFQIVSRLESKGLDDDYDVIVPTLGRAAHLENVLLDLSSQDHKPFKVIIIEQNPVQGAASELGFLQDRQWPFKIDHELIDQLGACNARNMALDKLESTWVFFADDDIRFNESLVKEAFTFISRTGVKALSFAIASGSEQEIKKQPIQWHTFGSGCSLVDSSVVRNIRFGMEHEFGFGEDSDFGMKMRNRGIDIIYYPNEPILHLKAPIGGFRTKAALPWDHDAIQPKPSPMVMAHRLKHATNEQLKGYKTTLFLKFFRNQGNMNPFSYFRNMSKRWNKSMYWAKELIDKYNPNGV